MHAFEARRAFVQNIARGESAISVAEAALQIAAEDDAIVSHSTVRLPIKVWQAPADQLCACSPVYDQACAKGFIRVFLWSCCCCSPSCRE